MAGAWSSLRARVRADPSWAAFLAFAFLAGVDARLARIAVLACAFLSLVSPTRRRMVRFTAPAAGALVYMAVAAAVSAALWATLSDPLLRPAHGFRKLTKLLWFAAIPLCAAQVDSRDRLVSALGAFVRGAALTAAADVFLNPLLALFQLRFPTEAQVAAGLAPGFGSALHSAVAAFGDGAVASVNRWIYAFGRAENFSAALAKQGTLADAQRLMAAIPACICLALDDARAARSGGARARAAAAKAMPLTLLLALGLLVCAKRGPALVALAVSAAVLLARFPRRAVFATVAAVALAVAASPARVRYAALPGELSLDRGGRALMWTRLVPALHAEHPWGVGFRALTWEKCFAIDRRTELGQDHVHSVPLQTFVELGWIGLAAWAIWSALCFRQLWRLASRAGRPDSDSSLPESIAFAAPLATFSALWLCSLATPNLTDPATVLLYVFSTGLAGPSLLRAAGGR